ncbi:MAG: T9SS type A sorting domain-containing protein [Saprospiraceae bacterium]|nr:T9SS type A sorting domain-containing protein [Saprospiraceae bacterium]
MKKQSFFSLLLLCTFLLMQNNVNAAIISWKGGSGNFNDPAKWDLGRVPGINDVAQFGTNAGSINLGGFVVVGGLVMKGGGLDFGTIEVQSGGSWEDGSLYYATLQIDTFANFTVSKGFGSQKTMIVSTLKNFGTIQWLDSNLEMATNCTVFNAGIFFLTDATSSFYSMGSNNKFMNEGRFVYDAPNGECNFSQSLVNQSNGIFEVLSGVFKLRTPSNLRGTVNVTAPGVLEISSPVYLEQNGTINGGGTLRVKSEFFINTPTPSTIATRIELEFGILKGTSTLEVLGNMKWLAGNVELPLTVGTSGILTLDLSNAKNLQKNLTNNGLIIWLDGPLYFNTPLVVNNGEIILKKNPLNIYGSNNNKIVNNNLFVMDASSKLTCRVIIENIGALEARAGSELYWQNAQFINKGVMRGQGFFNYTGGFNNQGTTAPGLLSGTLLAGPNYNNVQLNIAIQNNEGAHSKLAVNGTATLSGVLTLNEIGVIAPNDTFEILTCNGSGNCRQGTFATTNLPEGYSIVYGAKNVLAVKSAIGARAVTATGTASATAYPNPFHSSLTVEKDAQSVVTVYDMQGRIMVVADAGETVSRFETENWAPGVYIIQTTAMDGKIMAEKVVKTR